MGRSSSGASLRDVKESPRACPSDSNEAAAVKTHVDAFSSSSRPPPRVHTPLRSRQPKTDSTFPQALACANARRSAGPLQSVSLSSTSSAQDTVGLVPTAPSSKSPIASSTHLTIESFQQTAHAAEIPVSPRHKREMTMDFSEPSAVCGAQSHCTSAANHSGSCVASSCSFTSSLAPTRRRPSLTTRSVGSLGAEISGTDGNALCSASLQHSSSFSVSQSLRTPQHVVSSEHRLKKEQQQQQQRREYDEAPVAGHTPNRVRLVVTRSAATSMQADTERAHQGRRRRVKPLFPVTSWLTKQQWARELRRQWLSNNGSSSSSVRSSVGDVPGKRPSDAAGGGSGSAVNNLPAAESEETQEARSSFYCNAELCSQAIAHIRLRAAQAAQRARTGQAVAAAAGGKDPEGSSACFPQTPTATKSSVQAPSGLDYPRLRQSKSSASTSARPSGTTHVSLSAALTSSSFSSTTPSISSAGAGCSKLNQAASLECRAFSSTSPCVPENSVEANVTAAAFVAPPSTPSAVVATVRSPLAAVPSVTATDRISNGTSSSSAVTPNQHKIVCCCLHRRIREASILKRRHSLGVVVPSVPSGSSGPDHCALRRSRSASSAALPSACVPPSVPCSGAFPGLSRATAAVGHCMGSARACSSLSSCPRTAAVVSETEPGTSMSSPPRLSQNAGAAWLSGIPCPSGNDEPGRLLHAFEADGGQSAAAGDSSVARTTSSCAFPLASSSTTPDKESAACVVGTRRTAIATEATGAAGSSAAAITSSSVETRASGGVCTLATVSPLAKRAEADSTGDVFVQPAAAIFCGVPSAANPLVMTGTSVVRSAASEGRLVLATEPAEAPPTSSADKTAASFDVLRPAASRVPEGSDLVADTRSSPVTSSSSSCAPGGSTAAPVGTLFPQYSSSKRSSRLQQASSPVSFPLDRHPLELGGSHTHASSDRVTPWTPAQPDEQSDIFASGPSKETFPSCDIAAYTASSPIPRRLHGMKEAFNAADGATSAMFSACAVHGVECDTSSLPLSANQLRWRSGTSLPVADMISGDTSSALVKEKVRPLSADMSMPFATSTSVVAAGPFSMHMSNNTKRPVNSKKQPVSELQLSTASGTLRKGGVSFHPQQQQQQSLPHPSEKPSEQQEHEEEEEGRDSGKDDRCQQEKDEQHGEPHSDPRTCKQQALFHVKEGLQSEYWRETAGKDAEGEYGGKEEEEEEQQQQAYVQEKRQQRVTYAPTEDEGVITQEHQQLHRQWRQSGSSSSLQQQPQAYFEEWGAGGGGGSAASGATAGAGGGGGGVPRRTHERKWSSAAASITESELRRLQTTAYQVCYSAMLHRRALHAFVTNFLQQTQSRSSLPFRLFLLSRTSVCCSCWGLLLLLVGIVVVVLSRQSREIVIPYQSSTGSSVFDVNQEMPAPVYVYYRIEEFYGNFRPYVKDGPRTISTSYKCEVIRSQAEAIAFRTFKGQLTLQWLLHDALTGKSIPPTNATAYPCGLQSVAIYNDVFRLSVLPRSTSPLQTPEPQELFIVTSDVAYRWDFVQYMQPNSAWEKEGALPWILTGNPRFSVWMHPPFTPTFQKLYGVIHEPLRANHTYRLEFIDARVLCLLGVIILWLLHVFGVFSLSWTVRHADMKKVYEEAINGREEDAEGGPPSGARERVSLAGVTGESRLLGRMSQHASVQLRNVGATARRLEELRRRSDVGSATASAHSAFSAEAQIQETPAEAATTGAEDGVLLGGDEEAVNAWIAEYFSHPIACLCPYHCRAPDPFTRGTPDIIDATPAASALPVDGKPKQQQHETEQEQQVQHPAEQWQPQGEQQPQRPEQHGSEEGPFAAETHSEEGPQIHADVPPTSQIAEGPEDTASGRAAATTSDAAEAHRNTPEEEGEEGGISIPKEAASAGEKEVEIFPDAEDAAESEAELLVPEVTETDEDQVSLPSAEGHGDSSGAAAPGAAGAASEGDSLHGHPAAVPEEEGAMGHHSSKRQIHPREAGESEENQKDAEPLQQRQAVGGESLPVLSRLLSSAKATAVRWESSVAQGSRRHSSKDAMTRSLSSSLRSESNSEAEGGSSLTASKAVHQL